MLDLLSKISASVASSELRDWVVYLLSNVPGLPPIIQTIHILAIAAVMGSVVFVNLRILGLAVPGQDPSEMIMRLLPFTFWALLPLVCSGLVFVIARPNRYFFNPVFGIKFALLVPVLVLTWCLYSLRKQEPEFWERSAPRRRLARVIALISLPLWLGVMMAGRWIAYADYLFW
jgi:hypothetical protein|tara:strand:+ start:243 stop:764 length:522 start_codon:yes stop_codon:yes gene_type:complete